MSKLGAMSEIGIFLSYFAFKFFLQVKFGSAAKPELRKVEKARVASNSVSTFRKECRNMLKALCQKFQERSPLKFIVIRSASSLFLCNMAKSPEVSTKKFEKLVDHLHKKQHISSQQCYDSKSQYDKFLDDVKRNKESFSNLDSNVTRLDQFFGTFLNGAKEFKRLAYLQIFVYGFTWTNSNRTGFQRQ